MANRNFRHDGNLNERIAAIRENNARLENRHREIELDKQHAVETGSSIHPSQIKITICRNDTKPVRNGAYENVYYRNKGRQGGRPRGGGFSGPLGYNLSKSLSRFGASEKTDSAFDSLFDPTFDDIIEMQTKKSRLPYDANSANSQPQQHQHQQFHPNRPQGGRGGYGGGGGGGGVGRGGFYSRGGGSTNHNFPPSDYVRHVEIDRFPNRGGGGGGRQPRYYQSHNNNNRNFHGPRNGQYQSITPAKSMPSLDPALFNQNSRPFNNNNNGNQGRGGGYRGNLRPQNLPPRFRHTNKGGPNGGPFKAGPPPPSPFPPPSPSQPTPSPSSQKWPSNRDRSAPWVRGNTIKSSNSVCRVATVSTKEEEVPNSVPDNVSPFINPDEDDDDGYIDDNPLDDLDQFTLKIDMDGGFVVHDATICDPILSKPISSWVDEITGDLNDNDDGKTNLNTSSHPEESYKSPGKDGFDLDGYIFSDSSLTTSGVSTLSSIDCRLVRNDLHIRPIARSYSADQLDKISKPHQNDNQQEVAICES